VIWDQVQCEILHELGLRRYALASSTADVLGSSVPAKTAFSSTANPAYANTTGPSPGHFLTSALLQALARAAACTPDDLHARLDLAQFQPDPAGKRALWPQLRRLRATRR